MRHSETPSELRSSRIKRLAARIDELAEKDKRYLQYAREIAALRLSAAAELHKICRTFVTAVNQMLSGGAMVVLDPPEFVPEAFHEDGVNLLQISVRGRILQVEFSTTGELVSTEEFRVPYTCSGTVRAFNQELLEKDLIEEQLLFFTLERDRRLWRFFDARTYRTGAFDQEYLIALMEQLL